jgi:hypothetical protein
MENDVVTTGNDIVVDNSVVEPVVPAVVAEPVVEPKEKSTAESLDEVIAKVKARDEKAAATKTPAEKTPSGEPVVEKTPAAFTPNLKFKVKDKEHEIPAYLKDSIKNAETEKQIKDLCERAFGLDGIKAERAALKQEFGTLTNENAEIKGNINELRNLYQRGDLDSFFAKLKIPQERVLQYALEKAQYLELPPEQRAMIDSKRNVELQAYALDSQNQKLSNDLQQQVASAKRVMLDATLLREDVASAAQAFDSQAGKPGAFRQLVTTHGETTWYRSNGKIDLTPEQAVQQVMETYGIKPGAKIVAPAALTAVDAQTTSEAPTAVPKKPVPVIPNIQGKSTSPLKNKPRSTDDLKKMYAEKFG